MDISQLQYDLRQFRNERDWQHYHTPQNLAQALAVEAGELLECFLWGNEWAEPDPARVAEECADVMIYLVQITDAMGIQLEETVRAKIIANGCKYPAQQKLDLDCTHGTGTSVKAPGLVQVCTDCGSEVTG